MSAFIVSEKCMHRCVAALEPDETNEVRTGLGRLLYAMNADAVDQCYKKNNQPPDYDFADPGPVSRAQLLKSLKCLFYQCSEGDVPRTELYGLLRARIYELDEDGLGATPEYDAAEWD